MIITTIKALMKAVLGCALIAGATLANAAELVQSDCLWKPSPPVTVTELQDNREPKFNTASNPSDDMFLVKEKGRTYFYSLPNKSCKTQIFIVQRDSVAAIDYFPNRSGIWTEFARVIYYSTTMKNEISGWIEMINLCRINANGICLENGLSAK